MCGEGRVGGLIVSCLVRLDKALPLLIEFHPAKRSQIRKMMSNDFRLT